MNLPAPRLDSRTFDDLVREARARIPRYTPEWTDLNDSDPGMTLVKLHAWMTETILYELNRVPDLTYVKFLDLLGVVPMPARPARTELTFVLDDLGAPTDPLAVPVPLHAKVAVDDPDLPRDLVFETDRSLLALNAHVGAVFGHSGDSGDTADPRALVTRYDEGTTYLHSFAPFDPAPTVGSALYVGLLLRPHATAPLSAYVEDRLPDGPLDLWVDAVQVHDEAPDGTLVAGPLATRCPPLTGPVGGAAAPARHLVWQLYTGDSAGADHFSSDGDDTGWTDVALSGDDTLELVRSGHLVLEVPAGATPLSPTQLSPAFWRAFGQPKPPSTVAELVEALEDGPFDVLPGLAGKWAAMGVDDPDDLTAFSACAESVEDTVAKVQALPEGQLRPDRLSLDDWTDVDEGYAVDLPQLDGRLRALHWLRARVVVAYDADEAKPSALRGVHLNTASATQAATRLDDDLGRSTGRPAQVFPLPKAPVLIDPLTGAPDLVLHVGDDPQPWERRDDFFRSGPGDRHYLLDPVAGRIVLGDGRRGAVPVADARVTATRWRTGGGEVGNVPAGTVSRLRGRIRHVASAANVRAAHDGSDAEPLETVKLRAPHDLRTRDRAVSAEDFRDLALRAPGAALHKAYALPRTAVQAGELTAKDGAVTLVVLPRSTKPAPQPSEAQLRAVCRWLEPRRLVTTELHVVGPRYATVERLAARITVRSGHDVPVVLDAVLTAVTDFLHPLRGGADGTGWPFGEDLYHADLYDLVLGVDGVRRVRGLTVELADPLPDDGAPPDVTPLPEGHLPLLTRNAVHLVGGHA